MHLFTIKTQTALALLVAASLPQVAHGQRYEPVEGDLGQDQTVAVQPQAPDAASHYSAAAVAAMGARYDAMASSYASRPGASYLSAAAVKAMGGRYQAQVATNDSTATGYVVGGKLVAAGQAYDPADATTATREQSVRPDDRGGIRGVEQTQVASATSSGSFDWTDASIGAAGGLGLSLLLVGGLVLGLSTRREHKVASV